MPNTGSYPVIMLDKERHMRLNLKGMREFKRITGIDLMKGGFSLESFGVDELSALLWASLIHEDSSLTQDQVDGMVDMNNLVGFLRTALAPLLVDTYPDKKDGEVNPPNRSNGLNSGPSGDMTSTSQSPNSGN